MEKRKHILMIEDNEGDVLLAKEAFNQSKVPVRVSVAFDGAAGIEYLESQLLKDRPDLPDLILLDINLPKKSGHEVLAFIKSHSEFKQIPVVMMSTSSLSMDVKRSYANHANSFITKPLDLEDFLKAISEVEYYWLRVAKLPSGKIDL